MKLHTIIVLFACVCAGAIDGPQVNINQGRLQGSWKKSHGGRNFGAFEGIPYARPPLGKYRFMDPQKPEPWLGVWDATKVGSECVQIDRFVNSDHNLRGNEDCLFVNVYTTNLNEDANLPVIVHIHGGAFMFGTGNDFMPKYLLEENVVYVAFNYRLNVFGFLSTEDSTVPGNVGLKDQSAALHWIQQNIKKFGGDPNSVTLTGLSAGGASVHYHYLSPLSQGTFHKGFAFSGTALCPWTLTVNPLDKAKRLAEHVGCGFGNTEEMVECLRQRPASAILEATKIFDLWTTNLFSAFTPVVEPKSVKGAFLTKLPYQAVKDGDFSQVPLIATVTSEEGLYPAAAFTTDEKLEDLEKNWDKLAPYIFVYNDTLPKEEHSEVARKIKNYYMGGAPVSKKTFPKLVKALSDRHFVLDVQNTAFMQAAKAKQPIYFYYFKYRGPQSLSDAFSGTTEDFGVSHADDVFYILDTPYLNPSYNKETMQMSKFLVDLMYSFAATGVPKVGSVEWEPITSSPPLKYLDISSPTDYSMKMVVDLANNDFWKSINFKENEKAISHVKEEL